MRNDAALWFVMIVLVLVCGTAFSPAASITPAGPVVTLPVSVANGGTGNTAVGSAGTVAYSDGTKVTYTSVGANGDVLISGAGGPPGFNGTLNIVATGASLAASKQLLYTGQAGDSIITVKGSIYNTTTDSFRDTTSSGTKSRSGRLYSIIADSTVTDPTAATDTDFPGVSYNIGANGPVAGKTYLVIWRGRWSKSGANNPTLQLKLVFGSAATFTYCSAATGVAAVGISAFYIRSEFTIRSATTMQLAGIAEVVGGVPQIRAFSTLGMNAASTGLDFTVATTVKPQVNFSNVGPTNQAVTDMFSIWED